MVLCNYIYESSEYQYEILDSVPENCFHIWFKDMTSKDQDPQQDSNPTIKAYVVTQVYAESKMRRYSLVLF